MSDLWRMDTAKLALRFPVQSVSGGPMEHQRTQAYLDGWVLDHMPIERITAGTLLHAFHAVVTRPPAFLPARPRPV